MTNHLSDARPGYPKPQHPHGDDDRLLTTDEVAELLRTPPATLRYWRNIGTGPRSFKPGRHVMYWISDILDWIETRYASTQRPAPTESRNGHSDRVPSEPPPD
jgi:predicted DNA-binding transcriptional regulator AlpA